MKVSKVRMLVALGVMASAVIAFAFSWPLGTPSSFGIGQFFLLCPLGGLEAFIADRSFIPQAAISLAVVAVLSLAFGRAWCAWGCPAHVVRGLFGKAAAKPDRRTHASSLKEAFRHDSRLWVLSGVLIATLILGFPVFCLVCPIGLTFGAVFSLVQLISHAEVTVGLVIFPAALAIELVVIKKWCISLCPIAAILSLFGRFAKPLRPEVSSATCLRAQGGDCQACSDVCPEAIDLHADNARQQMADCTRCGECKQVCPTRSITMPLVSREKSSRM